MGLPDIIIEFSKKAVTAIQNGSTGIVGIMLKDAKNKGAMVLRSVDEIPTGDSAFSAENTAYIERAFIGSPSKVIIYTMDTTAESYDEATKYFATQKVNYIVGAPDLTTEEATKLATWVKGIRKNSVRRPVAVLPKTAGDSRGVINFEVVNSSATDKIEVGEKQYTEAEYCSRIAGLLAGLDLRVSATYKPLIEVTAIPLVDSDEEVDTAIDAGKLTLYNDGERVVIARGVNSLTTVTEVETADLQKIKINAIQDQIEGDIYSTINKSYIGNYSNSYDNKCLLITAIKPSVHKNQIKFKTEETTISATGTKVTVYLEYKDLEQYKEAFLRFVKPFSDTDIEKCWEQVLADDTRVIEFDGFSTETSKFNGNIEYMSIYGFIE